MSTASTPRTIAHKGKGRSPLSAKVRAAIDLMATEGLSQTAAADRLGIDRSNLSRQMARHDAQALILQRKAELAESLDALTEQARRRAMTCALDLMENDKPLEIRAKMVELFVKAKLIVMPVNVAPLTPPPAPGYTYRRPIDVTPSRPSDHGSRGKTEDD